jgi:hypothetical protein
MGVQPTSARAGAERDEIEVPRTSKLRGDTPDSGQQYPYTIDTVTQVSPTGDIPSELSPTGDIPNELSTAVDIPNMFKLAASATRWRAG